MKVLLFMADLAWAQVAPLYPGWPHSCLRFVLIVIIGQKAILKSGWPQLDPPGPRWPHLVLM
jgi:hypothetical protein